MEAPAASNTKVTAALREELATVRAALANERSACRALQRDRAAEIRAVREEEGRRRRDALCDLRSRLERDHEDALQRQKDAVKKTLDAEMLRELKAKDAELRHLLGEAHAREEALKLELRDAVRAARDTGSHEQQQQEHGGDAHRLQQEVTTLRERNRQLEERLELVVQADREKTAELRSQHEEHQHQLLQLTRTTQQEAHRLLEELRSKERALVQLQRRLDVQNERCDELLERRARESDSSEEKGMKKASGTHAQDKKQVIRRLRDMEGGRQKAQKRDDPSATPVQMVAPAEPEPSSDPELELEQLRSEIEERDRTIARLRQAAKEKDRKLDHLTNRHRKEQQSQLHKLFTELEPVAELEEEEDEDEEDSGAGEDSPASSGSPSLSPQPWAELYSCLLELQRENQFLQTRLRKAQAEPSRVRLRLEHELASTRTQVRELRKKLAEAAALEAEAHDLREQNELLEFRVLELQESEACTHTDGDGDVDVRARLLELAKTAPSPAERARLQQALALLDGQDAADAPRRIVATVLPFTSDADTDADGEVDELRRTLKNAECLQESGIFEEAEVATRSTQTELGVESTDLSAEIQKLTQFRERVERGRGGGDERLQLLEDKARLQAQVERLAADNRRLDEERCELEEAENDARLKYQQLEGKLATLNERRAALQTLLQTERGAMSRLRESLSESERKQQEAKERMRCLELLLRRYETRNTELEERESAVRGRLELLQRSVPALLVWSMWRAVQDRSEVATQSEAELRRRVQELECKERAYMETLRQADDLWADVEDSYKSRVAGAEEREAALRTRLEDSETRLRHATRRGEDAQGLLERLQGVEAGERAAQDRARRLEAERGRLLEETDTLRRALDAAQAELERMRGLVDGPLREELRRERARSETLQGEVRALERDQREQTAAHDAQLKSLKAQLGRTSRDLVDLECTNGELKEEVDTLEAKVSELKAVIDEQKQNEEKLVISMSQTILQKEQELEEAKREMRYSQMPSAHEELKKAGGVAEAADQQIPKAAGEPTAPAQGAEEPKKVLPVKPCGCKCMCGAEPSKTLEVREITDQRGPASAGESASSFQYSESEYSRTSAEDFPFGESGRCVQEPPRPSLTFTDSELERAINAPAVEGVQISSRERLFQEEFPSLKVAQTGLRADETSEGLTLLKQTETTMRADPSFTYSESEYSRVSAEDIPFGEVGKCILEPPKPAPSFTDSELERAINAPALEHVVLGSRERLFDGEFPFSLVLQTIKQERRTEELSKLESVPLEPSFTYSESEYSRLTAEDFPFGEEGECILEPPKEPLTYTDSELERAINEPPVAYVELGSKERLFQHEYQTSTEESKRTEIPIEISRVDSETKKTMAVPAAEKTSEDVWPRFIDDVCNIELEEDLRTSPLTYGFVKEAHGDSGPASSGSVCHVFCWGVSDKCSFVTYPHIRADLRQSSMFDLKNPEISSLSAENVQGSASAEMIVTNSEEERDDPEKKKETMSLAGASDKSELIQRDYISADNCGCDVFCWSTHEISKLDRLPFIITRARSSSEFCWAQPGEVARIDEQGEAMAMEDAPKMLPQSLTTVYAGTMISKSAEATTKPEGAPVDDALSSVDNILDDVIERILPSDEHGVPPTMQEDYESGAKEGEPQGIEGAEPQAGAEEVATAAALEAVLTPEVVGQLGEADATREQRLQSLVRVNEQLQHEVQQLKTRSREKSVEMAELRAALSQLQKKMRDDDVDVFATPAVREDDAAPLPTSVRDLQSMMVSLQKKCRTKDQMVMALAKDLRVRSVSGAFEDLLRNVRMSEVQLPEKPHDFDKEKLCKYLKSPVGVESRPPPTATFTLRVRPVGDVTSRPQLQSSATVTTLEVLRRVDPDCLLLGWTVPPGSRFSGFEIFVNGSLAHKVWNPSRNKAVLRGLDFSSSLVITMYALTPNGRVSEPAHLVLPGPEEEEIHSTKYT